MLVKRDHAAAGFGTTLRTLRERAGLTQEELAERAGLTPHAVSALERGTRTRPYPHTVRSLAHALNLTEVERSALIETVPSRRGLGSGKLEQTVVPAAPAPAHRAGGVVVPPTRLYGRDGDVAALASLIRAGTCRLVTLTGPGGVGKTRLAAALSEELAAEYPDGIIQVGLASVVDPSGVVDAIGRALGLASNGPDALDVVAAQLCSLRSLLVLDNFEHLLSAAGDVAGLVSMCPKVTVLVSSRSPLRVRGEVEYAVGPLALPVREVTTARDLAVSPSGALLLDRARAVAPAMELTPDNVRALGTLCQRLAGIPLAIELATARLRVLSPQDLLDRLDDVTSVPGVRDLPQRQQTMRATLDWSYGLLSPDQQALFTVLGVFRGGATLEAVEEVAAGSADIPTAQTLELLELLVEHSMVTVRPGDDGRYRYTMLEPVAQYARSRLVGELAVRAVRAHAKVYLALAEKAAIGYAHWDQVQWLARIQAEEPNILAAIDRTLDGADPETAGRIIWAMWLYWWLRGQLTIGRRRAEQCLNCSLPPALEGRVHLAAATMSYAAGDVAASSDHWAEAFRLGAERRDAELACKGRAGMGLAALAAHRLDIAAEHFRESLPLSVEAGAEGVWLRSLSHVWLGTVLLLRGDPPGAVAEIEQGLQLARQRGDRLSTYVALYNLSQAAIANGDHALARTHLEEGIALSDQTEDLANLAYFLETLAVVEAAADAPHRVAVLLGAARFLRETVGADVYAYYLPDESLQAAAEEAARTALGKDAYDDAVDAGRALQPSDAVRFALGADLALSQNAGCDDRGG